MAGSLQHGADGRGTPRHRVLLDAGEARIGEELHNARVVGRACALAHAELASGQHEPARLLGRLAPLADVGLRQGSLRLRPGDAVGHQPSCALERGHGGDGARPGITVAVGFGLNAV